MTELAEIFFNKPKVIQVMAQYACRVPARRELNAGEKKALENTLKELDSANFQLFDEPFQKNPMCLFQVLRQVPIGSQIITLPSFIFSNDSLSFFFPTKMLGKPIPGVGSIDGSSLNVKVSDWGFKVQNGISNLSCQRAGKIYELVLGPFEAAEKPNIFGNLFKRSLNSVGEMSLSFADYVSVGKDTFNIQTRIAFQQASLGENFFVNLRVDINNRNMAQSMDPAEVVKVWGFADSAINRHLNETLVI